MKKLIKSSEYIFGMTNIDPSISGIDIQIWSEHRGALRHGKHNGKRVKIDDDTNSISISIEPDPKVVSPAGKRNLSGEKLMDFLRNQFGSNDTAKKVRKAMKYVGKHYELFEKHSEDEDNSYNDLKFLKDLEASN